MNEITLAYQKWCLLEQNKDFVPLEVEYKVYKSISINLMDGFSVIDPNITSIPCLFNLSNLFKEFEKHPNGITVSNITHKRALDVIFHITTHIDPLTNIQSLNSFLLSYKNIVMPNVGRCNTYSPIIDIRLDKRFNTLIGISAFKSYQDNEVMIIPIQRFPKLLLTTSLFKYVDEHK